MPPRSRASQVWPGICGPDGMSAHREQQQHNQERNHACVCGKTTTNRGNGSRWRDGGFRGLVASSGAHAARLQRCRPHPLARPPRCPPGSSTAGAASAARGAPRPAQRSPAAPSVTCACTAQCPPLPAPAHPPLRRWAPQWAPHCCCRRLPTQGRQTPAAATAAQAPPEVWTRQVAPVMRARQAAWAAREAPAVSSWGALAVRRPAVTRRAEEPWRWCT